ncbi:hypothetical protein JXO59_04165 [candidate division KSB1 bacterium]|nr:hypothetical protein [candidate division KSB1 bacterium]
MQVTKILFLAGKIILLTIIIFFLFSMGTVLVGFSPDSASTSISATEATGEQVMAALALLLVCFIDVVLLSAFILRSRYTGIRLIGIVALVYYGIKTFMTQIETWYFMTNVTSDMLCKLFLMTVPTAILFPPIAVAILGRWRADRQSPAPRHPLWPTAPPEWIWKIAFLIFIVYPLLYFGFGYFIAWKQAEVRAFYGGTDPGNFIGHLTSVFAEHHWLYFFQVVRGLLWVGLAMLVIRSMRGSVWEMGWMVALLFAILMNNVHLLPNALMPAPVRLIHFIETASSNFLWAWCIVGLLLWHPGRRGLEP